MCIRDSYQNGELEARIERCEREKQSRELEMKLLIGLGFRLSFVPIFIFPFHVRVTHWPFPVLVHNVHYYEVGPMKKQPKYKSVVVCIIYRNYNAKQTQELN